VSANRCSFCGLLRAEVKKLATGPAVAICEHCVGLCVDILQDDGLMPPPLTWSSDPPREPGWYWWTAPGREPEPGYVHAYADGEWWVLGHYGPIAEIRVAGPLSPPPLPAEPPLSKEAEARVLAIVDEKHREHMGRLADLVSELAAARAVVEAALRLRDSGYDGPFIGGITVELFDALAAYERRDSTTRGGTK
jgi:hypothetical protein